MPKIIRRDGELGFPGQRTTPGVQRIEVCLLRIPVLYLEIDHVAGYRGLTNDIRRSKPREIWIDGRRQDQARTHLVEPGGYKLSLLHTQAIEARIVAHIKTSLAGGRLKIPRACRIRAWDETPRRSPGKRSSPICDKNNT